MCTSSNPTTWCVSQSAAPPTGHAGRRAAPGRTSAGTANTRQRSRGGRVHRPPQQPLRSPQARQGPVASATSHTHATSMLGSAYTGDASMHDTYAHSGEDTSTDGAMQDTSMNKHEWAMQDTFMNNVRNARYGVCCHAVTSILTGQTCPPTPQQPAMSPQNGFASTISHCLCAPANIPSRALLPARRQAPPAATACA